MELKIREMAELARVSVRTLQYYDKIGLLPVTKQSDNGYRIYTASDLDRLQEILLFKALGFELKDISEMISASDYERLKALKMHRSLTRRRMKELEELLENINGSIQEIEEGIMMKKHDKFKGMDFRKNPYEAEAREKWGDERVEEANAKIRGKSDEELGGLQERMNRIFEGFAALVGTDPEGDQAVSLCGEFFALLNQEVGSFYDKKVFKGLGQMYVDDERFTENLDRWGEGTARFMRDAMAFYSDHKL